MTQKKRDSKKKNPFNGVKKMSDTPPNFVFNDFANIHKTI